MYSRSNKEEKSPETCDCRKNTQFAKFSQLQEKGYTVNNKYDTQYDKNPMKNQPSLYQYDMFTTCISTGKKTIPTHR